MENVICTWRQMDMWEICIREKEEMAVNPTHGKAAIWGICVYHRLIIFDNAFGRHILQKITVGSDR